MSASLAFLIMLVPLAAVLLLGLAAWLGTERTGLHRGALAARWIGLLAGGAVMIAMLALSVSGTWPGGRLGLGALTGAAPIVGAGVLILAILIGELTIPAHGAERAGSLVPRSLGSIVPRTAAAITAGTVLLFIGLSAITSRQGSADDLGNPGRSFSYGRVLADGTQVTGSIGPFPGTWYTVPAGAAALLLLVLAVIAILVIHRRRPSLDAADALLRSRSLVSVLGAVVLGLSLVTAAFASFAQHAYRGALLNAADLAPEAGPRLLGLPDAAVAAAGAAVVLAFVGSLAGMLMVCIPSVLARGTRTRAAAATAPAAIAGTPA